MNRHQQTTARIAALKDSYKGPEKDKTSFAVGFIGGDLADALVIIDALLAKEERADEKAQLFLKAIDKK